jgi:transposase
MRPGRVTGELFHRRLSPTFAEAVGPWLAELPGPVAVAYEAGRPDRGFGLARELTAAGVRCVVAAPSKPAMPAG